MLKIQIGISLLLFAIDLQSTLAENLSLTLTYTDIKVQIAQVEIRSEISFDEAVESLRLRANQHNLKFVGVNQLNKEIEALTGKPSKHIEIYNFCDGVTAQKLIAANSLMIAFMPCRIAILEDTQGKRWIITMLIHPDLIREMPDDTRKNAERIMSAMKDVMIAASNGDL